MLKKTVLLLSSLLLVGCTDTQSNETKTPIYWCIENIKEQESTKFTYTYDEINGDTKINENNYSYSYLVNTYYSYTKYDTWYCKVEFSRGNKTYSKNAITYIKCEKIRR